MKKMLTLTIIVLLLSCIVLAQQEPDRSNVVYYLNSANQTLKPLEEKTASNVEMKRQAFGTGETIIEFEGSQSSVRLKKEEKLEFTIRLDAGDTNLTQMLRLIRFKVKKNKRQLIGVDRGFGLATNNVEFTTSKYGANSFKIIPAKTLEPGEYAFFLTDNRHPLYCFGVDK